eukprot:CAMPEP_0201589354 /NCGR_PEP_ID=MMETSP0190_2-20130828/165591_1 /ASSEMBLY_ACC=CAM_ASM_000263 /TAXON_ID=37353 /ORGANISM="Rosalina sp." /LENGTH=38 /DNA_ID= /DNA_START= /DNA_END= /DNA_ORIENTATION=
MTPSNTLSAIITPNPTSNPTPPTESPTPDSNEPEEELD